MKQVKNLIALYKPQIIPQHKDVSDLCSWLNSHLDIEEFPFTEFSNSFINQLNFSAVNAITNQKLKLTAEQFQFVSYRLLPTEKNRVYNASLGNTGEKYIYVIFERNTGYISTNNALLQLELSVEQGVSQYDYDNNTDIFLYYITCLERLKKKEY